MRRHMKIFNIDKNIRIRGPYISSNKDIAYSDLVINGITRIWAVIYFESMMMTVNYLPPCKDEADLAEKLLRFTIFWMKHEIGVDPRQVEFNMLEDEPLLHSTKHFKKITIVKSC